MSYPKVSILVRSMDRPTLPRTLDSVVRQEWPDLEIVLVAASAARHRPFPSVYGGRPLRFVVPPAPLGRAAAANAALEHARGDLCNFLDDDDEFLPDHVPRLAALLEQQRRCALAYARQQVVNEAGQVVGIFGEGWSRALLFERPCFGMAAAMFRRAVVPLGCRFDERLQIGEDHDFWLQCAARGPFAESTAVTSRWHAFIGTSGGGAGRNSDDAAKRAAAAQLRRKWRHARRDYLATPRGRLERAQFALRELPGARALLLAERAASYLPGDVNALRFAALANHRVGRRDRALELIDRALASAPGNVQLMDERDAIAAARTPD